MAPSASVVMMAYERELCGCLRKISHEERTDGLGGCKGTVFVVSFARYTTLSVDILTCVA